MRMFNPRISLSLLIAMLSCYFAFAQDSGLVVSGVVTDQATGTSMPLTCL